ncbi:polysaccharide deacetylase family protein [Candidatus Bathyarchaeota archaeon]|nr:polysaccharide deacetylase family protein [Candidatus Bathyarchaeota archaeon]
MATRFITLALAATAAASASHLQKRAAAPVIVSCSEPNTIALTFDDGPFAYTDEVLDLFEAAGMKATFFVNGKNWGNIYDYEDTVRRTIAEGHQIGSHT